MLEGTVDAGNDAAASTFACGAGGVIGSVRIVDATTLAPIAGATATSTGCSTATTDDSGTIQANLAEGSLLKADFAAPGYIPQHIEVTPQASGFFKTVYMNAPSAKTSLFAGWTSGSGYALVNVSSNAADGGSCTPDGLVASVNGHPEIIVGYLSDGATRDGSLTATNASGFAVLGPMPPGTYEFDATKTACTAGPDYGTYFLWPQTMDVEADTLSVVQLKLP